MFKNYIYQYQDIYIIFWKKYSTYFWRKIFYIFKIVYHILILYIFVNVYIFKKTSRSFNIQRALSIAVLQKPVFFSYRPWFVWQTATLRKPFRRIIFNSHDIPKRKEAPERMGGNSGKHVPLTFNRQHMSGLHRCEISLLDRLDEHTAPHACVPLKAGCLHS